MVSLAAQYRFTKNLLTKLNCLNTTRITLIVAVSCLALGYAFAFITQKLVLPKTKGVNIFEADCNECPEIRWANTIDSIQMVLPVSISGNLTFAGERVPLEDPEVRERLERELQLNAYWHSNTLMAMKQANRYFGEIEKILKENGVPADLKYIALIESGFRHEVSPAGAASFWQILKETGKQYGLEVGPEVDERYHLEKSTAVACKYFKQAYDKFGSWTTAAASYNLGMAGMQARINDQKTSDYYEMFFNPETSRYVFRALAMKVIFSNPKKSGYHVQTDDLYQPFKFKVVEVDTPIHNIADFAAGYNLKYKHIKTLNPWLREAKLTNKERKKYQIKILEL